MNRTATLAVIGLLFAASVSAQEPQVVQPVAQPRPAQAPQRPVTPPAPPSVLGVQVAPAPPRPEVIPTQNVRVELAITDSAPPGPANKKTVTMLIADGMNGRIRSSNSVRVDNSYQTITINVDATAKVRAEGRIQVMLNFEYTPDVSVAPQGAAVSRPGSLSESLTVLVPDGRPVMVSQSADPATDRKVTVEVTATIVK